MGFSNATQITFGANRTECQFAIEDLYYSAVDSYEILTYRWFYYFDIWEAFDIFLVVPHNLYTLQSSCTESYDEIVDLGAAYGSMF